MSDLPPLPDTPTGRYRHYKGGEYEVLGVARHSETLEALVIYRPLYNASGLWARPHGMFFGQVEVDGVYQSRFVRIDSESDARSGDVHAGPVYLRRFALDDTATIFRLSLEEGMKTWLPDQVYADEAEARDVLTYLISQYDSPDAPRKLPYVLAVCLSDSHELIGHVGFSPCSYGVEVGYAIATAYQNRGHAKRAVGAATAWAVAAFGLPAVCAVVAEDNANSCKVLEASGFRLQESLLRKLHGIERMCRVYRYTAAELPTA